MLNANDLIETYGYDRLLLSAITSPVPRSTSTRGEKYKGLIGVSGRAAANVLFSASQQVEMLVDGAGEPGPEDHAGNPGADRVQLRQVAMRAPMIWDMRKVGRVGWWNETLGALGMGDLDVSVLIRRLVLSE